MRHLDDSLYRGLGKIRLLEVGKETDNKTGCFLIFMDSMVLFLVLGLLNELFKNTCPVDGKVIGYTFSKGRWVAKLITFIEAMFYERLLGLQVIKS